MPILQQNQLLENENTENQWRNIYTLGSIITIIVLLGIVLDLVIGNITGGNLSALPQTAVDRFTQFRYSKLLGLYNLEWLCSQLDFFS